MSCAGPHFTEIAASSLARRRVLAGLACLVAAPTIVRATSLMHVRALPEAMCWLDANRSEYRIVFRQLEPNGGFAELVRAA